MLVKHEVRSVELMQLADSIESAADLMTDAARHSATVVLIALLVVIAYCEWRRP